MPPIQSVRWSPEGAAVRIIDQRELPERLVERDLRTVDEVCEALSTLAVRGAPAIGVAAAMGLAVALAQYAGDPPPRFAVRLDAAAARIRATRPTAVNLPWAMERMRRRGTEAGPDPRAMIRALLAEADAILEEDRAMCQKIGEHGLPLLPDGVRVLTHCNAGALATAGIGTALAPIYLAHEAGRRIEVFVDETRPLLQGSRLTAWELGQAGIAVTVLADNMAASLMREGRVDCCLVGADRIAANGDVANKIGTYGVAVLAHHHDVPLYVAAPASSFDPAMPNGDSIPIEHRARGEIACAFGRMTTPTDAKVYNPAFDVTPAKLVRAIVSDRGVHRQPYDFRA